MYCNILQGRLKERGRRLGSGGDTDPASDPEDIQAAAGAKRMAAGSSRYVTTHTLCSCSHMP
jgi:hypothetical protein